MVLPEVSMLRSRSGRRRKGLSSTVAPPITIWLPPPVARWLPLYANFSAVNRLRRASLEKQCIDLFQFFPIARGRHI